MALPQVRLIGDVGSLCRYDGLLFRIDYSGRELVDCYFIDKDEALDFLRRDYLPGSTLVGVGRQIDRDWFLMGGFDGFVGLPVRQGELEMVLKTVLYKDLFTPYEGEQYMVRRYPSDAQKQG